MRALLSVTMAAAVGLAAAAGSQAAPGGKQASFKDSTFSRAKSVVVIPDTWPFLVTAPSGERVAIGLSKRLYDQLDVSVAQEWADFLGSLVHGPELSSLEAYFLTPSEVTGVCGRGALACYGGNQMFAPADDPAFNLTARAVAMHEYGHHVAAHRLNDPWEAIDTGTKRWATYERVCPLARRGQFVPGAEDEQNYFINPGEGYAEAFRVLNERKASLQEAPWEIVTNLLYPDGRALALIEQDVTSPWRSLTRLTRTGAVTQRQATRSFVISTPLDGPFRATLTSSANARFRIDVLSPAGNRLDRATGRRVSASATICGDRALRIRVSRVSGAGAFKLTVARA